MKAWETVKEKLEALSGVLRLHTPPYTIVPDEDRLAEHALHELAHAYLLGWRVLRWPAMAVRPKTTKASRSYTIIVAGTTNAGPPRQLTQLGLSTRIGTRLRNMHSASPGAQTGSFDLTDAHEMCAVAVVYRLLCRMAVAPEGQVAQWMADVQNTRNIRPLFGWRAHVDEPAVAWCEAAILADLEAL